MLVILKYPYSQKCITLDMGLGDSMATSVRSGIKLEGSGGNASQISTITVVTAGGVGQTLVVQPVQQASVVRNSIDIDQVNTYFV